MRCIHCNREISEDARFCIYCGSEVEDMLKAKKYAQKIKELEQECRKLKKEKEIKLNIETDLKLKLDNYIRIQKGMYPGCRRWKPEPVFTGKHVNQEEKSEIKKANYRVAFLILSIISCFTVCLPWINVPLLAEIMDYAEVGLPLNVFNIIGVMPVLADAIETAGYWFDISDLCAVLMADFVLILVFMGVSLLFYGQCIFGLIRNTAPEKRVIMNMKEAAMWGIASAVGVWLVCFFTNLWLEDYVGDYHEYLGMALRTDVGAWLLLIMSVAAYLCFRNIYRAFQEGEKMDYKQAVLEITNYDPVLPFRPVRLNVKQSSSFTGCTFTASLKVMNYMHQPVNMITGQIHIWSSDGEKYVLPTIKFQRFVFSDSSETELSGQFYGKQLDCDFSDFREAKLYISNYRVSSEEENGSYFSVDSEYQAEELKTVRTSHGDDHMMRESVRGENWMCICGQIYNKELKYCPLCGKENRRYETNHG